MQRSADRRSARGRGEEPRPQPCNPGVYRRRRLLGVLLAVVLIGGGVGVRVVLFDAPLLDVGRVTVTGAVAVPQADVLGVAGVPDAVPLARIDTQAVADRVAALPAIASVTVSRSWPHTVVISVVERVPVATLTTATGVELVDRGGAVFPGVAPPGLPALTLASAGPGDPVTRAALSALAALPAAVGAQVDTFGARLSDPGAPAEVTFALTGGRQVVWGSTERATEKAAVLVPLLTQKGHVFDVSSPDLPTVRR